MWVHHQSSCSSSASAWCPSVGLSVLAAVRPSQLRTVRPSLCLSCCPSAVSLSQLLSVRLSVPLSQLLPVCLSVRLSCRSVVHVTCVWNVGSSSELTFFLIGRQLVGRQLVGNIARYIHWRLLLVLVRQPTRWRLLCTWAGWTWTWTWNKHANDWRLHGLLSLSASLPSCNRCYKWDLKPLPS
jgi:hypothetical protein